MTWPKEVPILEAKNMHKGSYNGPNGTHCLLGWSYEVFPINEKVSNRVVRAIFRTARIHESDIADFNDDKKRPKTELAAVWNKAMARLGYVVGNPEA